MLNKKINFCFNRVLGKPYAGAIGWIDQCLFDEFSARGFKIDTFCFGDYFDLSKNLFKSDIPLNSILYATEPFHKKTTKGINWYSDRVLNVANVHKSVHNKNLLFFHTFDFSRASWLGNKNIDLFITNADYMTRSIRSLMSLNVSPRQVIDPRDNVVEIRVPFPTIEFPNGYDTDGFDMPVSVEKLLNSNHHLGVCIQPGKTHPRSLYAILYYLHELSKSSFDESQSYRFILPAYDVNQLYEIKRKASIDIDLQKLVIPVPILKNTDVSRILKRAHFSICFNEYAEPMGFYPLESIYYGCPVYTNGAGNNRFLLPKGHGIKTIESTGMYFGRMSDFYRFAESIHRDVLNLKKVKLDCMRGKKFIEKNLNRTSFKEDIEQLLNVLNSNKKPKNRTIKYELSWSPFHRLWNKKNKEVVTDIGFNKLTVDENRCLSEISLYDKNELVKKYGIKTLNTLVQYGVLGYE